MKFMFQTTNQEKVGCLTWEDTYLSDQSMSPSVVVTTDQWPDGPIAP